MRMLIRFLPFGVYEYKALEEYLNEKARQGYRLARMEKDGRLVRFALRNKETPVTYNVMLYEESTEQSWQEYRLLCQEAGWRYLGNIGKMRIFETAAENQIVSLQTDAFLEWETLNHLVSRELTLAVYALLAVGFFLFSYVLFETKETGGATLIESVLFAVISASGGISFLWMFVQTLRFIGKAKRCLRTKGALPHIRWHEIKIKQAINTLLIGLTALCVYFVEVKCYGQFLCQSPSIPFLLLAMGVFCSLPVYGLATILMLTDHAGKSAIWSRVQTVAVILLMVAMILQRGISY